MPTLYTHYTFGNLVLNKLNNKLQDNILQNKLYYNMFNQGFDNLYYYLRKWNTYRNFGIKAHTKNIDKFFYNMLTYIKNNNLNNDLVCTMVFGFINHYTLDTLLHPFINYQRDTLNIPHTKIEFMLDNYILNKYNNNFWNNKIFKEIIPKVKFTNNLNNLINYTFKNTYNKDKISKIFYKSHNTSYYLYRYFIFDRFGIKSKLYKIIDFIFKKQNLTISKTTFILNELDERILNNNHDLWYYKNNSYNYSFPELFDYTINICVKLNEIAYQVLNNKLDINIFIDSIKMVDISNILKLQEL